MDPTEDAFASKLLPPNQHLLDRCVDACIDGAASELAQLIAAGCDVNAIDPRGNKPSILLIAMAHRSRECVELLLAAGALLEMEDGHGNTPLLYAARAAPRTRTQASSTFMVEALIKHGATVRAGDDNARKSIAIACKMESPELLGLLLGAASPRDRRILAQASGNMLLGAGSGCSAFIALLWENGASLDEVDCDNRTPAMVAAGTGHADCLRTLAELGCDLGLADTAGMSAMHHAAKQNSTECVALLHTLGIGLDVADAQGRTPSMLAALAGDEASLSLLASLGADFTLRDHQGNSVLDCAQLGLNAACLTLAQTAFDRQTLLRDTPTPNRPAATSPRL